MRNKKRNLTFALIEALARSGNLPKGEVVWVSDRNKEAYCTSNTTYVMEGETDHQHSNMSVLDQITESPVGTMLFNGQEIGGMTPHNGNTLEFDGTYDINQLSVDASGALTLTNIAENKYYTAIILNTGIAGITINYPSGLPVAAVYSYAPTEDILAGEGIMIRILKIGTTTYISHVSDISLNQLPN